LKGSVSVVSSVHSVITWSPLTKIVSVRNEESG
jgi:hypothetical protein